MEVVYLADNKNQSKKLEEGAIFEKAAIPDPRQEQVVLVPMALQSKVPESVKVAVERLRDDLVSLNEIKDHVAFLMAVNINTAKAELVPIPTLANMVKMRENIEQFPDGIKAALKKNISTKDMKAVESIWHYLDNNNIRMPSLQATNG